MKQRLRHHYLSLPLAALVCLTAVACKKDKPASLEQAPISFQREGLLELFRENQASAPLIFDIEIADNEYEIQTGMMYRDQLEANQGMLFVFPDARYRSFYMKNTRIPLDIIYIAEDSTIVSIQKNARPLDEQSLPSDGPARFVLEVKGGLSDQLGITVGNRISFRSL